MAKPQNDNFCGTEVVEVILIWLKNEINSWPNLRRKKGHDPVSASIYRCLVPSAASCTAMKGIVIRSLGREHGQRRRHGEAERVDGLEVDDEFKIGCATGRSSDFSP